MLCPPSKKKWTIQWKLNPFRQYRGEYGREIKPVPGETYLYVTSPAGPGASISLDFDKLLFESLTKRGRAIKHNRTHATAWKKYASYIPTKQDHAGLEKYITKQTEKTSTDSIQSGNDEPILLYDDYIYPDNDSLKLEAPELTPAFQPVPLLPIYSAQPDSVKQQTAEKRKKAGEKNKSQGFTTRSYPRLPALHQATRSRRLHPPA